MNSLPQSEIKALTKLLKVSDESTTSLIEEQLKSFDVKLLREIDSEIPLNDKALKDQFLSDEHEETRF